MQAEVPSTRKVVVIGGGPAGLTAAYELIKAGATPCVVEKLDLVGGLARTENYKGFHFDLGGHRFFTKSREVQDFWKDILADDFLQRPRLSRIYYRHKFFHYPLKPVNALLNLGFFKSLLIFFSYLRWQLFPYKKEETFEQWVTNRFGRELFLTFFKSYTEKVWGIPCSELRAEWAAQRIKDLSLKTAIVSMFFKPGGTIKTLIEQFDYPRRGPGMMWTAVKRGIEKRGGEVKTNADVIRIDRTRDHIDRVVIRQNGVEEQISGTDFISSMPLTEFVKKLHPPAPPEVLEAAKQLKYRDFLTVCLIVNKQELFPDNWLYIHDPDVRVGRIQNFKNWSPEMVPDASKNSLGLEYFCNEGDDLWTMADADLIELGKREVEQIGLVSAKDVEDGHVVRVPKSYPVYDADYRVHLDTLRNFVGRLHNFQTIGRNGLHRYNNQDHAMLTGMLAVRNLLNGESNNLWNVNADQEYHEEVREDRPDAPKPDSEVIERVVARVWGKVDRVSLASAVGVVLGAMIFLATWILVLKGGDTIGPNLALLGQVFPGYTVTAAGSLIGLGYGFATGFVLGWFFALLRNGMILLTVRKMEHDLDRVRFWSNWDYL